MGLKSKTSYHFVRHILVILLVVLAMGCSQKPNKTGVLTPEPVAVRASQPTQVVESGEYTMSLNLSVSDAPALNEEADLGYKLTSLFDEPGTTLTLVLPEGVQLVSGQPIQTIDIKKGEATSGSIRIKAVEAGEWEIEGIASRQLEGSTVGCRDGVYLLVTNESGEVSDIPFHTASAVSSIGESSSATEPLNE